MISSMKLNHEKLGLLNSYSVPTLVSQDSLRLTRQSQPARQFPDDWDSSDCHLLASMFTDWCGEEKSAGIGPVPSLNKRS